MSVNCEYADWSDWGECDAACGGGKQIRTRDVVRQAWYGGTMCTAEEAKDEQACNEAACPGTKILLLHKYEDSTKPLGKSSIL